MKIAGKDIRLNKDAWIVIGGAATAVVALISVTNLSRKPGSTTTPSALDSQLMPPLGSQAELVNALSRLTDVVNSNAQHSETPNKIPLGDQPVRTRPVASIVPRSAPPPPAPVASIVPRSSPPTPLPIVALPTAGELAREPSGGWTTPPPFQQTSPTEVRDTTGGGVGIVNPGNRLLGYSDPQTGNLSPTWIPGSVAIWA